MNWPDAINVLPAIDSQRDAVVPGGGRVSQSLMRWSRNLKSDIITATGMQLAVSSGITNTDSR